MMFLFNATRMSNPHPSSPYGRQDAYMGERILDFNSSARVAQNSIPQPVTSPLSCRSPQGLLTTKSIQDLHLTATLSFPPIISLPSRFSTPLKNHFLSSCPCASFQPSRTLIGSPVLPIDVSNISYLPTKLDQNGQLTWRARFCLS